jgi:hypothetical protein
MAANAADAGLAPASEAPAAVRLGMRAGPLPAPEEPPPRAPQGPQTLAAMPEYMRSRRLADVLVDLGPAVVRVLAETDHTDDQ